MNKTTQLPNHAVISATSSAKHIALMMPLHLDQTTISTNNSCTGGSIDAKNAAAAAANNSNSRSSKTHNLIKISNRGVAAGNAAAL